ncbi:MAG TPA: GspH/FimT family pseudopilin [Usitatibacter sp.]|nr:GspH/FimT family pseudopilin [Usitatibacter sp.]
MNSHPSARNSHPKAATRRVSSGFTMIEMITVVAIIGILFVIAQPAFTTLIANQRARGAATELMTAMMKTRSEAVKRNQNVTLAASGANWEGGWQIRDLNNAVLDSHEAISGITFTGGPATVVYQSSGRIQGNAAPTFLITSVVVPTAQRCVSADLSGRPNLKAAAC